MSWTLILTAIFSLLGPIIQALIERFLNKAVEEMPPLPSTGEPSVAQVAELFDRAYKKTGYFQWFRQAMLKIAKKAAVRKAAEIVAAARGLMPISTSTLTVHEAEDITSEEA
jgi:hypothetical protein